MKIETEMSVFVCCACVFNVHVSACGDKSEGELPHPQRVNVVLKNYLKQ